jgi:hypothetical protein
MEPGEPVQNHREYRVGRCLSRDSNRAVQNTSQKNCHMQDVINHNSIFFCCCWSTGKYAGRSAYRITGVRFKDTNCPGVGATMPHYILGATITARWKCRVRCHRGILCRMAEKSWKHDAYWAWSDLWGELLHSKWRNVSYVTLETKYNWSTSSHSCCTDYRSTWKLPEVSLRHIQATFYLPFSIVMKIGLSSEGKYIEDSQTRGV